MVKIVLCHNEPNVTQWHNLSTKDMTKSDYKNKKS